MSRVIVRQLVEEETFEKLVSGKKRKRGASEAGSVASKMTGASSRGDYDGKYKTGGSGIHRDTENTPGAEYKSKKVILITSFTFEIEDKLLNFLG